jgi:uncharacterized protein
MRTDRKARNESSPRLCAFVAPVLVLAFAMHGCSAQQSHYYALSAVVKEPGPKMNARVLVGPVNVPESVDRPQLVVQISPNHVDVDDLNRWVAPLGEGIAAAIAGNLQTLLATREVAVAPLASFDATHRVTIDVQRFDSLPGKFVVIDALWNVIPWASGVRAAAGRTLWQEPVAGPGYEEIAAAHDRALAKVSEEIAGAIRKAVPSSAAKSRR